jgi:hypothetical protein
MTVHTTQLTFFIGLVLASVVAPAAFAIPHLMARRLAMLGALGVGGALVLLAIYAGEARSSPYHLGWLCRSTITLFFFAVTTAIAAVPLGLMALFARGFGLRFIANAGKISLSLILTGVIAAVVTMGGALQCGLFHP